MWLTWAHVPEFGAEPPKPFSEISAERPESGLHYTLALTNTQYQLDRLQQTVNNIELSGLQG